MLLPSKREIEDDKRYPPPMPQFEWNPDYEGTMKPGTTGDNYPLEDYMHATDNMKYQELDMDEREDHILPPDHDLLEWLAAKGRLIAADASEDDGEVDVDQQLKGITEEDLEFDGDEDDISHIYRKDDPSQDPYADYGGFA